MIIRSEDIKDISAKILYALDAYSVATVTDTLNIAAADKKLALSVTNGEYFAEINLTLDEEESLNATVKAPLFLKLISQLTSDTIELTTTDSSLNVIGNGSYKLPLIFDGDKLLKLPEIKINNETSNFKIKTDVLHSIMNYNSKELNKGSFSRPVQQMYYVDEKGCITFTTGACVNNFNLEKPVKILLNNKLVKLFKLFKTEDVDFTLGQDALANNEIQTKVRFNSDNITITAILTSDTKLISSVPADVIRSTATNNYDYSIAINKDEFIQSINRILLLASEKVSFHQYGVFEFDESSITIYDEDKNNKEVIYYENEVETPFTYSATIDLNDFKVSLDNCKEQYITLCFGNSQAFVIKRNNIYNVIPECTVD